MKSDWGIETTKLLPCLMRLHYLNDQKDWIEIKDSSIISIVDRKKKNKSNHIKIF